MGQQTPNADFYGATPISREAWQAPPSKAAARYRLVSGVLWAWRPLARYLTLIPGKRNPDQLTPATERVFFLEDHMETRIAGIPCKVRVDSCVIQKGSYSYNAPSDWDYYGYQEIEFTVCDRRGREAPWLSRKMTDKDIARIEQEIIEHKSDQ
jgi:hypothetical protein